MVVFNIFHVNKLLNPDILLHYPHFIEENDTQTSKLIKFTDTWSQNQDGECREGIWLPSSLCFACALIIACHSRIFPTMS